MYERILVPLDGSELAAQVVPYVTEIARNCGSEVVLLQAIERFSSVLGEITGGPASAGMLVVAPSAADYAPIVTEATAQSARQQHEGMVAEAHAYLTGQAGPVGKAGVKYRTEVIVGAPADGILSYARDNSVDLIAMSTHGRGGLGRLVFGSVADAVLRNARLPVLLIPPRA